MSRQRVLLIGVCSLVACDPHDRGERNPQQFFQIGGATETLENPSTDPSIELEPSGGGDQASPVYPGDSLSVSITFDAPNGNVSGAGIRFGDSGPITVVPVPDALGQTSGTMQLSVTVPADICGNLSEICHDIRCYEFAVTSVGQVSVANINALALVCGNCDEPSCQELLTDCEDDCNVTGCPQGEICINTECVPATAQNSCAAREPSCCPGQDDSCTAPDAQCFCDDFCTEAGDCCPDACQVCGYC